MHVKKQQPKKLIFKTSLFHNTNPLPGKTVSAPHRRLQLWSLSLVCWKGAISVNDQSLLLVCIFHTRCSFGFRLDNTLFHGKKKIYMIKIASITAYICYLQNILQILVCHLRNNSLHFILKESNDPFNHFASNVLVIRLVRFPNFDD